MGAKAFRQKAWGKLSGKWGTMALIWLVYSLIIGAVSGLSSYTYGMSGIVMLLVSGPFTLSLAIISLHVVRSEEVKFDQLFDGFKGFGSAFVLALLNSIFIFLWSLLFIIPGIIKSYAYKMSFYILRDNPDMEPNDARKESIKMMNGNKWRLFCLDFSFIGWLLLCILTLGILFFWVGPYMEVAHAEFYEDLKQKQAPAAVVVEAAPVEVKAEEKTEEASEEKPSEQPKTDAE